MTTLFSTMTWIWPAKTGAAARRTLIRNVLAPFETLHRLQWSAPWGGGRLRRGGAARETEAGDMKGWTSQAQALLGVTLLVTIPLLLRPEPPISRLQMAVHVDHGGASLSVSIPW